jgi:hypothetical protein
MVLTPVGVRSVRLVKAAPAATSGETKALDETGLLCSLTYVGCTDRPVRKATNDGVSVSATANTLMHKSLLIGGKTEAPERQTPALQTAL